MFQPYEFQSQSYNVILFLHESGQRLGEGSRLTLTVDTNSMRATVEYLLSSLTLRYVLNLVIIITVFFR